MTRLLYLFSILFALVSVCVPVPVPCGHCGEGTPVYRPVFVQATESLLDAPVVIHFECLEDWCECH